MENECSDLEWDLIVPCQYHKGKNFRINHILVMNFALWTQSGHNILIMAQSMESCDLIKAGIVDLGGEVDLIGVRVSEKPKDGIVIELRYSDEWKRKNSEPIDSDGLDLNLIP